MSNYVKITDFASKDTLSTGNPLKLIKGTEINDELNAIQTAVGTKADLASPAFTGNPTAATQTTGNSTTRVATTAFVQQEITANASNVNITGGTIANVTITGGSVSGLATDLAVEDGGTGASTFTANSVVLGNGTSSLAGNMVAPSTSGNVLTSNGTTWTSATPAGTLGVGQTWQNVLSSRAAGTSYQNTTGKPIQVTISGDGEGSDKFLQVSTDNSTWINVGTFKSVNDVNASTTVPNNHYYRLQSGAAALLWAELR